MKSIQRGLTIIELLMSMAIIGILASVAVPSFTSMKAAHEVASAAEKIRQDFLFARSEAIKQNSNMHISIATGASWCYGFTDALSCTCSTANSCKINASDNSVNASEYSNIALSAIGGINNDTYFTPVRGAIVSSSNVTLTNSAITVSKGSSSATVNINALGRANICSNSLSQFNNC